MTSVLDSLRPLLALQVLVAWALVILFRLLYARLRREEFLRWWAAAAGAHGACLALGWLWLDLGRHWSFFSGSLVLATTLAGYLEIPLLVLGARALQPKSTGSTAGRVAPIGLALGVAAALFAVSTVSQEAAFRFAIRNAPRFFLLGLAYAYCTAAFLRQQRLGQSGGANAIAAACAALAAVWLIFAYSASGVYLAPPGPQLHSSPVLTALTVGCQLSVALGLVLWMFELASKADQQRKASEDRYRDLVENATDIIFACDVDGNLTALNRAGQQALGYSGPEVLQLNLRQLLAPEFLTAEAPAAGAHQELDFLTKGGRRLTLEVSWRAAAQDGQPAGMEGIARDITQRKALEEQLLQAHKMEAIGRLAGGVAHDFNNMLTIIGGFAQLAKQEVSRNSPAQESLDEVITAADRAAALTGQLLAFSRQQVVQPESLNLNRLLRETEKMLRRLIGERFELVTVLSPDLGGVEADPVQMQQVLFNLVVNARDAMDGAGRIIVETENVVWNEPRSSDGAMLPAGPYVMLSVSDSGKGMDVATRSRVFEPFFTTKGLGKGTGLGLATVYGIVKQHHGEIEVWSEPGAGTTFKFYLPRIETPEAADLPGAPEWQPQGGTETILLVEDEAGVRTMARRLLAERGYQVLDAASPQEALGLATGHEGQIHLLLTDVVMPDMNGRQLAARLLEIRPDLRVLYMSGYSSDFHVDGGAAAPDGLFLQKPFSPGGLLEKLRQALEGK